MLDDKDLVQDENTAEEAAAENPTETQEETTVETAEAAVEEKPAKKEEPRPEDLRGPHDDFDWSIGNRNTHTYSDEEIEKYLSDYEGTLGQVQENSVVSGLVTAIHSGDVVLDINYKSDGLVSLSEFRDIQSNGRIACFPDVFLSFRIASGDQDGSIDPQ